MPLFNSMRLRLFEGLLAFADRLSARMGRSAKLADHLELGLRGEEAAFFHLRHLGFTVVARRWHSHRYAGDLDLVAWENDTLCFIEVKTRSSREIAAAEAAVDDHKQKTLRRIARHYMRQSGPALITRFDVLSIYFEQEAAPEFHLFRGAFDWS
jgi:putative endonuclease